MGAVVVVLNAGKVGMGKAGRAVCVFCVARVCMCVCVRARGCACACISVRSGMCGVCGCVACVRSGPGARPFCLMAVGVKVVRGTLVKQRLGMLGISASMARARPAGAVCVCACARA